MCPNCGSEGKEQHTNNYGVIVCEACWTDYVSLPYTRGVRKLPNNPIIPKASESPAVRPNSGNVLPLTTRNLKASRGRPGRFRSKGVASKSDAQKLAEGWSKLKEASVNTLCLLCGRIFYHQKLLRCKKCLGACQYKTDEEMGLGGKWQGRGERSVL